MAAAPEQKSIPYLSRGEFVAFVCLLLFTMIVNAKGGADWPQYLDWQHYFLSFDLSALARYPKSSTRSSARAVAIRRRIAVGDAASSVSISTLLAEYGRVSWCR